MNVVGFAVWSCKTIHVCTSVCVCVYVLVVSFHVCVASFERARQVVRGRACTVLCIVLVFLACWYHSK